MNASPRLVALLETMTAAIVEPDAERRRAESRSDWLSGRGIDPRDAESLAAVDDQAWFVYRHLVRSTIKGAIETHMPLTREILGERFDADVEDFVSTSMTRSHYLRDVPTELLSHAAPRWRADPTLPAFLVELARYELCAYESAAARWPRSTPRATVDATLDLDSPVVLHESVRLERYEYPVHEIVAGQREVEPRPTALLIYRDRDYSLRTLELSPLAADIVERLLHGATLQDAITLTCTRSSTELTPNLLGGVARLLTDYADRGILLGTVLGASSGGDR